ncbi:hypothetical protein [Paraburkholderia aromaticivorans]|uniref:hypothetical protein n=1 Tax=Paraburkholderia aromaticivorans TaxID=2026199 RepID=UPI001FC9FA17|nr:hypothetical protein [Paraburkholderia aromaticivorans]
MEERIQHLLAQISALQSELRTELHQREIKLFYRITGKHIEFDEAVGKVHRELKVDLVSWMLSSRPQNFLAAPFVYGLVFPLVFLDICISIYQAICFPIYGIAKVKRADYIVMDRWQLRYLNFMERFHCAYCEYANGLIAYASEIAARTEQYWCPIKLARKVLGTHARYERFLMYGEAARYQAHLAVSMHCASRNRSARTCPLNCTAGEKPLRSLEVQSTSRPPSSMRSWCTAYRPRRGQTDRPLQH